MGSKGDSYDNAAAESLIGLYKTELIRCRGPWRGLDDVELATLEYVDWFNHRRLHSAIGDIPPVEYECPASSSWQIFGVGKVGDQRVGQVPRSAVTVEELQPRHTGNH